MIDRDFIELAALDAVALLDGEDQEAFAHECRINPELRVVSAEMGNLVAAVAVATTSPTPLPPQALAGIYARIAPRPSTASSRPPLGVAARGARSLLPWAAAAGFALLATWQGWRASSLATTHADGTNASQPGAPATTQDGHAASPGPNARPGQGSPDGVVGTAPGFTRPPRGFLFNRQGDPVVRLQQDNDRLRADVVRLKAAEAGRQEFTGPGTSTIRLIDMLPPGVKLTDASVPLGERAVQALAAGIQPPADALTDPQSPVAQGPLEIQFSGSSLGDDTLISGNHLPNVNQVVWTEDGQVRHLNFPPPDQWDSLGLIPVNDGTVYDSKGGILYHPLANGQALATKPGDDFQAPEPGEPYNGVVPAPPNLRPNENAAAAPPPTPQDTTYSPTPYAVPAVDQQGNGVLFVQNLPPAPEGEVYQLWMRDAQFSTPVRIATVQSPSQGFGYFSFQTAGFVPSGYLMTREKIGPVTTPSNNIVLKGPPDK